MNTMPPDTMLNGATMVSPSGGLAEMSARSISGLIKWRDLIQKALDCAGNTHNFDDVTAMTLCGRLHAYTLSDCMALMEVINYPRKRMYHCFIGVGSKAQLMELLPDVTHAAKQMGCDGLSMNGRLGWAREFARLNDGWTHRLSLITKELED